MVGWERLLFRKNAKEIDVSGIETHVLVSKLQYKYQFLVMEILHVQLYLNHGMNHDHDVHEREVIFENSVEKYRLEIKTMISKTIICSKKTIVSNNYSL